MRQAALDGTTLKLKWRWSDFTTLTRYTTRSHTTNNDKGIYAVAIQLFDLHWRRGVPVRLIGVGIRGGTPPCRKLGLWDDIEAQAEDRRLQNTLDNLRNRFGRDMIRRVSDLEDP